MAHAGGPVAAGLTGHDRGKHRVGAILCNTTHRIWREFDASGVSRKMPKTDKPLWLTVMTGEFSLQGYISTPQRVDKTT
jgi:hypothetical protein